MENRHQNSSPNYQEITRLARLKVLDLVYKAQTSHIGSNFSCIDIMAVIFEKLDFSKDKFILSKGWAAASLYYFLWSKGRITEEELDSFCMPGSKFIGLAEPIIPDIPFAGGSMGYGLPAAVGFALAKKLKGEEGTIYCLMSDGEYECGTTWESALIATQYKLDNLIVILDMNGYQAMGKVLNILPINLVELPGYRISGHNFDEINNALNRGGMINAQTVKGKGVSFMENQNIYHYKQLTKDEYDRAKEELRQP